MKLKTVSSSPLQFLQKLSLNIVIIPPSYGEGEKRSVWWTDFMGKLHTFRVSCASGSQLEEKPPALKHCISCQCLGCGANSRQAKDDQTSPIHVQGTPPHPYPCFSREGVRAHAYFWQTDAFSQHSSTEHAPKELVREQITQSRWQSHCLMHCWKVPS